MRKHKRMGFADGAAVAAMVLAGGAISAQASILVSGEYTSLSGNTSVGSGSPLVAPNNGSGSAPWEDEVLNTSPSLSTWAGKGAIGLEGAQSIYPSGTNFVNNPASVLAFKFPVAALTTSLNTTYGAGNWTVANPRISFQYTYYANNNVFGSGGGTFETYWVANNSWSFGDTSESYNAQVSYPSVFTYTNGTDIPFVTNQANLNTWAGSSADLGTTTYNWLSPTNNANYTSWSTDKTGLNQGILTDYLNADPLLVSNIVNATSNNADVSFYFLPSSTLGLCIFTGGGSSYPTLTFDVSTVPEPGSLALAVLGGASLTLRRRRNA